MEKEKILNQYEKEYMKMAMLKHEETFREQVYELHRLYQIQKILMKNIAKQKRQENHQRDFKNATNSSSHTNHNNLNQDNSNKRTKQILDIEQPAEQCYNIANAARNAEEESDELELTLGPSCYNNCRRKASENLDYSAPCFSSNSSESHGKSSREDLKWGITLNHGKSSNVVEEEPQFRQDRLSNNNPPWFFQALSLNMT